MATDSHKQTLKSTLFIIFICLLLWNIGAGSVPKSAVQEVGTDTPTEEVSSPDNSNAESPTPSPAPTSTLPGESNTPASITRPLPAVFATGPYISNELIVRFKPSTSETRIQECFQGIDVQVQANVEALHALVLNIVSGDLASTFYHILNCAGVLYVEPNFLLQAADTIPNDPNWGIQYGLVNIRAPQGWDLTTGSASVIIAIVDTGVDLGHPDLAGKLVAGYDFVNGDTNPQDDNGHGTHVAGIAAAISNNGTGVAGVSWGARIMPVKVLDSFGGGTYANTAQGVIWAVDHGAQVINLSLGGPGGTPEASLLEDAINYAHNKGAVIAAAAGNTGNNFVLFPARYSNVIAVARTNSTNNWDGSNYGPEIDLSAPGSLIYSTVIGGYGYNSGSSMSTGFVSGMAAILKSISGNVSPDAIEYEMESTALDIEFAGWDDYTGAGLIQMDAAIQLAQSLIPPPEGEKSSSAGIGNIPVLVASTNTPTPTWTITLTPATLEATVTLTAESSPRDLNTPTFPTTPTKVSEVEAQNETPGVNYLLPCLGILFVILGIFLLWYLSRKRDR